MKTISLIIICLALSFMTACGVSSIDDTNSEERVPLISGRIDDLFLEKVATLDESISEIRIASLGGETRIGLSVAEEIERRSLSIVVTEICLSACAEYLLPPARKIELEGRPLIGYHRSPQILGQMLKGNAIRDLEYCKNVGDTELHDMLERNGKPTDAWRETLKRLNLLNYRVDYKDEECPWSYKKFEYRFWFPSSQHLDEVFGLSLSGDLCADDPDCYISKLNYIYGKSGGKFIVGDAEVIVEKRE